MNKRCDKLILRVVIKKIWYYKIKVIIIIKIKFFFFDIFNCGNNILVFFFIVIRINFMFFLIICFFFIILCFKELKILFYYKSIFIGENFK